LSHNGLRAETRTDYEAKVLKSGGITTTTMYYERWDMMVMPANKKNEVFRL